MAWDASLPRFCDTLQTMQPSKVQKGDVAVLMLAARLVEAGLVVLTPLCEALPFDLVIYYKESYYRVQVKRAQPYKNTPRFEIPFRKTTPSGHGPKTYRYTKAHAEFLAGVVVDTGDCYLFPLDATEEIKAVIQVDPRGASSFKSANRKVDPEKFRNSLRLGQDVILLGRSMQEVPATRLESGVRANSA